LRRQEWLLLYLFKQEKEEKKKGREREFVDLNVDAEKLLEKQPTNSLKSTARGGQLKGEKRSVSNQLFKQKEKEGRRGREKRGLMTRTVDP